jgi:hypothetical protein
VQIERGAPLRRSPAAMFTRSPTGALQTGRMLNRWTAAHPEFPPGAASMPNPRREKIGGEPLVPGPLGEARAPAPGRPHRHEPGAGQRRLLVLCMRRTTSARGATAAHPQGEAQRN